MGWIELSLCSTRSYRVAEIKICHRPLKNGNLDSSIFSQVLVEFGRHRLMARRGKDGGSSLDLEEFSPN